MIPVVPWSSNETTSAFSWPVWFRGASDVPKWINPEYTPGYRSLETGSIKSSSISKVYQPQSTAISKAQTCDVHMEVKCKAWRHLIDEVCWYITSVKKEIHKLILTSSILWLKVYANQKPSDLNPHNTLKCKSLYFADRILFDVSVHPSYQSPLGHPFYTLLCVLMGFIIHEIPSKLTGTTTDFASYNAYIWILINGKMQLYSVSAIGHNPFMYLYTNIDLKIFICYF